MLVPMRHCAHVVYSWDAVVWAFGIAIAAALLWVFFICMMVYERTLTEQISATWEAVKLFAYRLTH
jgi:hypothetical protein